MVCHQCCGIVEKIYQFRITSIENDRKLKEQFGQVYVQPITDPKELERIGKRILTDEMEENEDELPIPTVVKEVSLGEVVPKSVHRHESVNELIKKYPGIKLPEKIAKCDINPDVTVDKSDVKDWYDKYLQKFQQRLALGNVVMKRIDKNTNSNQTVKSNTNEYGSTSVAKTLSYAPEISEMLLNNLTDADKISTVGQPNPPVNNSRKSKPWPKSKEVKLPLEDTSSQLQDLTIVIEKPAESPSVTAIEKVLSPVDSSKTQINLISTTTTDTFKLKKKRKPRKRLPSFNLISDEIIPQKKKRIYHNVNSTGPVSKLDIPEHIPNDSNQHLELLASSLGLKKSITKSTEPPVEEVFACQVCLKLYDTSKELHIHQRRHLTCKYCGRRMTSIKRLQIHEEQRCHKKIVQNLPKVQLTRVDKIKSISDKYSSAFNDNNRVCISDSDDDTKNSTSIVLRPKVEVANKLSNVIVLNQSITVNLGKDSVPAVNSETSSTLNISQSRSLCVSNQGQNITLPQTVIDPTGTRQVHNAPLPTLSMINTMEKRLPDCSLSHAGNKVSNTSTHNGSPKNTTVLDKEKAPFFFSDEELKEILSEPITSDHLPNTTFHYAPLSTTENPNLHSKQQALGKTPVVSKPVTQTPQIIHKDSTPLQWTSAPNKTVYQIPKGHGNNSTSQTTMFNINNSQLNATNEYSHNDPAIMADFANNTQLAEEWLQLDMQSNSSINMIEKYITKETQKLSNNSNLRMDPSMYMTYSQTPSDQHNYYNRQGGYQHSYETVPNIAHYVNVRQGHPTNVPDANRMHNFAPYANLNSAYNKNANSTSMANAIPNNSDIGYANSGPTINRYTVPNATSALESMLGRNPQHVSTYMKSNADQSQNRTSINQAGNLVHQPNPSPNQLVNRQVYSQTMNIQQPNLNPLLLNRLNANQDHNVIKHSMSSSNQLTSNLNSTVPTSFHYPHTNSTQSLNMHNTNQSRNVAASMPTLDQPLNLGTTNKTYQYPSSNSMQSPNPSNINLLQNVTQYSPPVTSEGMHTGTQNINTRRFSNPPPYNYTNIPGASRVQNMNDTAIATPYTMYSRTQSIPTTIAQGSSGLSSPPGQTSTRVRIKQIWELR